MFRQRAGQDERFVVGSQTLDELGRRLNVNEAEYVPTTRRSDRFIVIRTLSPRKSESVRHPLELVEWNIAAGIQAIGARRELRTDARTCLIAVSRGSLTGTFPWVYEVVRRCGWSVLPLGGSVDPDDIAELCSRFRVDTIVLPASAIPSILTADMVGRFEDVRDLLFVSGFPSSDALADVADRYPRITVHPFLYTSEFVGAIATPISRRPPWSMEVLDHVVVEVRTAAGLLLDGQGELVVTVLGTEEPALIRRGVGTVGQLSTNEDGRQIIRFDAGGTA